jgi:hypothetical protein
MFYSPPDYGKPEYIIYLGNQLTELLTSYGPVETGKPGRNFPYKNNPLWQVRMFSPEKACYFRFRALHNTEDNNNTGYAEINVLTN